MQDIAQVRTQNCWQRNKCCIFLTVNIVGVILTGGFSYGANSTGSETYAVLATLGAVATVLSDVALCNTSCFNGLVSFWNSCCDRNVNNNQRSANQNEPPYAAV